MALVQHMKNWGKLQLRWMFMDRGEQEEAASFTAGRITSLVIRTRRKGRTGAAEPKSTNEQKMPNPVQFRESLQMLIDIGSV